MTSSPMLFTLSTTRVISSKRRRQGLSRRFLLCFLLTIEPPFSSFFLAGGDRTPTSRTSPSTPTSADSRSPASQTRPSSSSSSSSISSSHSYSSTNKKQPLFKRFTHQQVKEKIEQRKHLPEYQTLLMACAVKEDKEGIIFDANHPAWAQLLRLVEKADEKQQKDLKHLMSSSASSSSSSASSSSSRHRSPPTSSDSRVTSPEDTEWVTVGPSHSLSFSFLLFLSVCYLISLSLFPSSLLQVLL
jgi:hypothetical protein